MEAAVDPGGDAGGGEVLAVLDPPLADDFDAEVLEDVDVGPVRRGWPVVEKPAAARMIAPVQTDMTISASAAASAT